MNIPFLSARRERQEQAQRERENKATRIAQMQEKARVYAALDTVPDGVFLVSTVPNTATFRFPNGTVVEVR